MAHAAYESPRLPSEFNSRPNGSIADHLHGIAIPGLAVLLILMTGCFSEAPPLPESQQPVRSEHQAFFEDITDKSGLTAVHRAVPAEDFPMPQIMGSGAAMLDADGDGLLDLLLVAGEPQPVSEGAATARCPLYLQDKEGSFRDHTENSGLIISDFGMGVAAGDIDNDGDTDVCITTAAGARMFQNDGAAVFQDITATAGIGTSRWCTAAVFFDYDRDGWLDLLIVNYVDYFPGSVCQDGTGRRDYCGPLAFSGTVDRLYRNSGGSGQLNVFRDVTLETGLGEGAGKGLGAICSDMNGDGRTDIYVANDMEPNRLWIQQPDGLFRDEADIRGCSTDFQGRPQASMGTAWNDFDRDGMPDIFLTHLRGETNTLYRQIMSGVFVDNTAAAGLGAASLNFTGFGVAASDVDLDGNDDLLIANGRVMRAPFLTPDPSASHWDEYAERNQLFLNIGSGQFEEVTSLREPFLLNSEVSRGLATGDIDNDGDVDVLISNTSAKARLFQNVADRKGNWIRVQAIDPDLKRDAIGARIIVISDQHRWVKEIQPCIGYLSCHDPRLHFGLGETPEIQRILVHWPTIPADIEEFVKPGINGDIVLRRGTGKRISSADSSEPKKAGH